MKGGMESMIEMVSVIDAKTFSYDDKEKISERLIGNFVEKIIDINAGISQEQLANLVARQFTVIKYRNVVTDRKIQKIYRDAIDKYLKKIMKLDME